MLGRRGETCFFSAKPGRFTAIDQTASQIRDRGLIMGDPCLRVSGENRSCDIRPLKRTPLFPVEIFCLAGKVGEKGDSGHNLGLDAEAKSREILTGSRTILRAV